MTGFGSEEGCQLTTLDQFHRTWLGVSLIIFGIIGAAINGWVISTLLIGSRLTGNAMIILLNLTIACLGRSLLGGFPFSGTSVLAGSWLFGDSCCRMFGFLRQFFGVAQLATLAFLSVERLIVSRFRHLEKRLTLELYVLGVVCCWLGAVTWSAPPLAGVGRYSCDMTGLACDVDWRRTEDLYHLGFNSALLVAGNVIPALITCGCTWRALTSPRTHVTVTEEGVFRNHREHAMNKTTALLVTVMFIAWMPQAILATWLMISPPTGEGEFHTRPSDLPVALVFLAPLSSEVSAILPVFVYLACEPCLRRALLGVLGKSPPRSGKMKRTKTGIPLTDLK